MEKNYVIENHQGYYWYSFEDSFYGKNIYKSTWYSNKKYAEKVMEQLLKEKRLEFGFIKEFYINK